MKILTKKSAKISRILLLVVAIFSIPLLFIAAIFEEAGGGTQRMPYLLFPLVCLLAYSAYILFTRRSDKSKNLQSKFVFIFSEIIIGLIALTIACLTMYAMITWNFEMQIFIILVGLIYISILILLDCLNDLKTSKKIM